MEVKKTLKSSSLKVNLFNRLLNWLDEDRFESAKLYKSIHNRLIMYFSARGCAEAEDLADITIDRVSQKIISKNFKFEGNKMKYFYSFAKNIHLEYLKKRTLPLNEEIVHDDWVEKEEDINKNVTETKSKLRKCLLELQRKERNLILKYYSAETGREKQFREKIAKKQNISINSLRVKVFRLKQILVECLEKHSKH